MTERIAAAALAALLLAGCREGVQPFTPVERDTGGPAYALTYGSGIDADPRWSPDGDTVLYHTNFFLTMPQVAGLLLAIPAESGPAAPVFPLVQGSSPRPFVTPAYSPAGDRIAFMDLMSVDVPASCTRMDNVPPCADIQPLLDSAVLRVRRIGEQGSLLNDPAVPVKFAGTDPAYRQAQEGPWFEQMFPFQDRYRAERALVFRPTWAPDGERVAFSDGLSIRIWNIGADASTVVPGTEDGMSAAWSPDGDWIAFTSLVRTDSVVYQCSCALGTGSAQANRTVYSAAPGTLVIIRPDGSERTELGVGEDPAWSPDGSSLFVRRDDMIVRIPRDGGVAVPVPNTERGRSPAVSPDGTRLAISRRKPGELTMDYDIWIVALQQ